VAVVIRRFSEENPVTTSSDRAREAGRKWQAETADEERRKEEER